MAWEGGQQLYAEPKLYCVHGKATTVISGGSGDTQFEGIAATAAATAQGNRVVTKFDGLDAIARAKEHSEQQAEISNHRTLPQVILRELKCILSVHVDDLKGAATRQMADRLLKHLESMVGKCEADFAPFTHTPVFTTNRRQAKFICINFHTLTAWIPLREI